MRVIHKKLYPRLGWRIFHILTCENIEDIIYHFSRFLLQSIGLYDKTKITRWLEVYEFCFLLSETG